MKFGISRHIQKTTKKTVGSRTKKQQDSPSPKNDQILFGTPGRSLCQLQCRDPLVGLVGCCISGFRDPNALEKYEAVGLVGSTPKREFL